MRCRRVRSFLSAYCSDELDSRQKLAISEHLVDCEACRKEEATYRHMANAAQEMVRHSVSEDFNACLLNRIADERFAETRTKAYLPKAAPLMLWSRVIPVVAAACLAVLLGVSAMIPSEDDQMPMIAEETDLDNSYLTVQPDSNPNMTVNMRQNWSLNGQLARAERANRISNSLTSSRNAGMWNHSHDWARLTSSGSRPLPYVSNYHRFRPVVRVYVSPSPTTKKEGTSAY